MGTGLAECVEASGIGGNRGLRVALDAAPSLLMSDETVLEAREGGAILPGSHGIGGILLLLTDKRVLMVVPTGWRGRDIQTLEIPFRSVTSVGLGKVSRNMYADVSSRDGLFRLTAYDLDPQELVTRIQWLVDRVTEAPTATPAGADPLDKLRKLSELRDMGVVSEEEFQQKKSALLDEV